MTPEGKKKGGVKTIYRDHLLPIGPSMRMPKGQSGKEVAVRPKMQATNTRKMKRLTKPIEHFCEAAEFSSEVKSDRPGRSYRDDLDSLK